MKHCKCRGRRSWRFFLYSWILGIKWPKHESFEVAKAKNRHSYVRSTDRFSRWPKDRIFHVLVFSSVIFIIKWLLKEVLTDKIIIYRLEHLNLLCFILDNEIRRVLNPAAVSAEKRHFCGCCAGWSFMLSAELNRWKEQQRWRRWVIDS